MKPMPPLRLPDTPAGWADAIVDRVGTYGIGVWLEALGGWLALDGTRWLPESSAEGPVGAPSAIRAVQLQLYALPTFERAPPRARAHHIVLDAAIFNARLAEAHPDEAALPFGLDAAAETPQSAAVKLGSADATQGRGASVQHISWTLDDNRVVELTFRPDFHGLEQVHAVRLWKPVQF